MRSRRDEERLPEMRATPQTVPPGACHPGTRDPGQSEVGLPDAPDPEERRDGGSGSNPIRVFRRSRSGEVFGLDSHNGESG